MTVRLRAHHLLCLLTYAGKGYSPAFTTNYDAIAGRLGQGEEILLVAGPDDVCAPLLGEAAPHCRNESVIERDRLAANDVGDLLDRRIRAGVKLSLNEAMATQLRQAFSTGRTRSGCQGCEWFSLCTTMATGGYTGARLHPPEKQAHGD